MISKLKFVYVSYINSTPKKVWDALINAKITEKYWGHHNVSDWKAGSAWKHVCCADHALRLVGKVVESKPPRHLVLTWASPADADRKNKHSKVTFEIESIAKIVRLTTTHSDLEAGSHMLMGITWGWPIVLSSLKSLLETGKPLPKWWLKKSSFRK